MTTYETLTKAREAAKTIDGARMVIEIDHAAEGRCYIVTKCNLKMLRNALSRKPMAEIDRVVDEHCITEPTEPSETEKLLAKRASLVSRSYSSAHPASAAYAAAMQAAKDLEAFDADNPEIAAQAKQQAAEAAADRQARIESSDRCRRIRNLAD
ncbi:hypothetical protein STSP2_03174 [Anaerohalosphaera lusitana]|uniref:Uncharacterized protein n=1 Tax=Anaerohalosphaera lusitana TaxID=1936003 RepID=A0A1U9NQF7_9BACT|nr:hypothetical protein [Anaerohalosphaera lusitana]AQT69974.1 hypothetical protein STSP2_03174 [Anaerohalosphaera lusitana]